MNSEVQAAALAELARKTMPAGALGALIPLAARLAGIQGRPRPDLRRTRVVVFVADHGVSREGVSAYPREVTAQMLANFAAGGAAVSVLGRALGVEVEVVDVGVDGERAPHPVVDARLAAGSGNLRIEPAMDAALCRGAMDVGAEAVRRAGAVGALGIGEMGIGNSTAAAALMAALTGLPARDCVGPGSGVEGDALAHKCRVVEDALARVRGVRGAERLLAEIGGIEIATMAGAILAAAERACPLVVDGFIASVAALVAVSMRPAARDALIFAHRSAEPGHAALLAALEAEPLLDLGMRLGEGSGAVLAMPLLRAAAAILNEMATFESAGVAARTAS